MDITVGDEAAIVVGQGSGIIVEMRLTPEIVRRGLPRPVGVGVRHVADVGEQDAPALYAVEQEALGPRAVAQRRTLFALGRAAARDALAELGRPPAAIPRGDGGQPVWPAEVVGSISHSHQVALAVVGQRANYAGLGVDVEELRRAPAARAARLVCRPAEMDWVDVASGTDRLLMLFSAKEAIFKALFPVESVWFGFADAELEWVQTRQVFRARVLKRLGKDVPAGFELDVNCTLGDSWVLSTAYVPRSA